MNKLVDRVCTAVDYFVEWSDWFNPVVWQALGMAAVVNSMQDGGWIE